MPVGSAGAGTSDGIGGCVGDELGSFGGVVIFSAPALGEGREHFPNPGSDRRFRLIEGRCARATIFEEFHRAALAAGGKDNGAPGLRPQYHARYYAALVIGPDGHNIEAVCHQPEA